MFISRDSEVQSYLEWRRQTRFIRRYGGPILACTLFLTCIGFVWRARHTDQPVRGLSIEASQSHDIERYLQIAKTPR
jgi:hypothetical protein